MSKRESFLGSGLFSSGKTEQVHICEINSFLVVKNISILNLMKINIEGGEYELLEHLIETGEILKIHKFQVQFHDFVHNAQLRRAKIIKNLKKTHEQKWNFHFVWEEWTLKDV